MPRNVTSPGLWQGNWSEGVVGDIVGDCTVELIMSRAGLEMMRTG